MKGKVTIVALLVGIAIVHGAMLSSRARTTSDALEAWRASTRHMADVLLKESSTVGEYKDAITAVVEQTNAHEQLKKELGAEVLTFQGAAQGLDALEVGAVCPDAQAEVMEDAFIAFLEAAQNKGKCGDGDRDLNNPTDGTCALKCKLSNFDCEHGGSLTTNTCPCSCSCPENTLWEGMKCNECKAPATTCANGGRLIKSKTNCECSCSEPWAGLRCTDCKRNDEFCLHGGKINGLCTCDCTDGWSGENCNKCVRTNEDCNGHGKINHETCKCECDEIDVRVEEKTFENDVGVVKFVQKKVKWYKGDLCNVCNLDKDRDCNGHDLDTDSCSCVCNQQWAGTTCNTCNIGKDGAPGCKNDASLDEEICECTKDCPKEFQTNAWALEKEGEKGEELTEDQKEKFTASIYCDRCTVHANQCKFGSTLNAEKCACEGTPHYCGTYHDTCCAWSHRDCTHGGSWGDKKNNVECACQGCEAPWTGRYCEACDASQVKCQHGATVNAGTCKCNCEDPWTGDYCEECMIKETDCQNGSKFDKEKCECVCDEKQAWTSDASAVLKICNVCDETKLKNCEGRGTIDKNTCTCKDCSGFSTGPSCTCEDKGDDFCENGGKWDSSSCRCVACNPHHDGDKCQMCTLAAEECKHGKLSEKHCDCSEDCPAKWSGNVFCGGCQKDQVQAKCGENMESFIDDKCECKCKPEWTGDDCQTCALTPEMCHNRGVVNGCKCQCNPGFGGDRCETCNLTDGDCQNGGTADQSSCSCKCPDNWNGDRCQTCKLTANDCVNGATWNAGQCKCNCPVGSSGDKCDQCAHECLNGGICQHGRCACATGWAGVKCDIKRTPSQKTCQSVGDPHPSTFDGALYNWYGVGEYVMYRNPGRTFEVHAIYQKLRKEDHPSWTTGLAVRWTSPTFNEATKKYDQHTLSHWADWEFRHGQRQNKAVVCCLDGAVVGCKSLTGQTLGNAVLSWNGGIGVEFNGWAEQVKVEQKDRWAQVQGLIPEQGINGLCGTNANGDPNDDFNGKTPQRRWEKNAGFFDGIHVRKADSLFADSCYNNLDQFRRAMMSAEMEMDEVEAKDESVLAFSLEKITKVQDLAVAVEQQEGGQKCCANCDSDEKLNKMASAYRFCTSEDNIYHHGDAFKLCKAACGDGAKCNKCEDAGLPEFMKALCVGQWGNFCTEKEFTGAIGDCMVDFCVSETARTGADAFLNLLNNCQSAAKNAHPGFAAEVKKNPKFHASKWEGESCVHNGFASPPTEVEEPAQVEEPAADNN